MLRSLNRIFAIALVFRVLLIGVQPLAGQSYSFQHITVDEGLNNSRVISILQDRYGFIWFATQSGMERYNGLDIKHYDLWAQGPGVAVSDLVNCSILSEEYEILAGTKNGSVYSYCSSKDSFRDLISKRYHDDLFNIYAILPQGRDIWIGTSNGLFFLDSDNDTLLRTGLSGSTVTVIKDFDEERVLVGTKEFLTVVRRDNFETGESFLGERDIISLLRDSDTLFVGTRNSEVFKYTVAGDSLVLVTNRVLSRGTPFPVSDIIRSPEGNIIVAFDGSGIAVTNSSLEIVGRYLANNDIEDALTSNGVYRLFFDKNNIFWVGTYGGGVNFYDPNKKRFKVIQHLPYVDNSLRSNSVNSLMEDREGRLWAGTGEGISITDASGSRWLHYPGKDRLTDNSFHVMSMIESDDGSVWVATYGKGLIRINVTNMSLTYYQKQRDRRSGIETDYLFNLIEDNEGRIWSGGIWGNLSVLDPGTGSFTNIPTTSVRTICELNESVLVGTLYGLFIVDKSSLEVSRPVCRELINSRLISIKRGPNADIIYLGTDGSGLLRWDIRADSVTVRTSDDGLPSNHIRGLEFDDTGALWITTNRGLSRYLSNGEDRFENFTLEDGIANSEFMENSLTKRSDGAIAAGGTNGITLFYPGAITASNQASEPIINSISLLGKPLEISDNGPLSGNVNLQESFSFNHKQNTLSIAFSAIGFTNPRKIMFKWMLDGFENQWNGPTHVREAIYSRLPPGDYTFRVMVTNDDGIWQERIKEVGIEIRKPFWRSIWAYLIYGVIISGILLLSFNYYQMLIHERNAIEKQQFFISIAHDLRTPLSLIRLPIEKMADEEKNLEEVKKLQLIKGNIDRLTGMVTQLLDFQKADLKKMQLQVEKQNIIEFIDKRLESFEPLATEKGIWVTVDHAAKTDNLWFDGNKMEKVIYNLLSNAFKYTPPGGRIRIDTRYERRYCVISIEDTGEGIPTRQQKNIFKGYYRASNAINSREPGSGVGLMLSKEIVLLHKGDISFTSSFGRGSKFTVRLRLGADHFGARDLKDHTSGIENRIPSPDTSASPYIDGDKGPTLLLVDDNPEMLGTLSSELSSGFSIKTASNGKDALSVLENELPEIIISDVMMPEMNGHQLCHHIKSNINTCHIPVILLTALNAAQYRQEALEYGADAYIEKPFDLKLLITQVNNLLRNREMLRKKFLQPSSDLLESSPSVPDNELLEKIRDYVIRNLSSSDLSVESTASELNMSRPVLYRKIKALTDLSPQQFLMTIKLKEAARIMREEKKNISETAYLVGFSDPKYFSQIFKKYFRITPSQFLRGTKS